MLTSAIDGVQALSRRSGGDVEGGGSGHPLDIKRSGGDVESGGNGPPRDTKRVGLTIDTKHPVGTGKK